MSANHEDNSTAQAPKGPVLCKMGCGFFGSDATGDCCSKCFMDSLKKKSDKCLPVSRTPASPLPTPVESETEQEPEHEPEPQPQAMEVDTPAPMPIKKKKKKKQSYKNMMKAMTSGDTSRDVKQEQREKIGTGVGGGAFSKIEKI
ncbi:unnamed protein product [Cylindrotheca closterium]|uniref:A20-type domain-containing protein n=1 Tax=Cylindrotheca closterium TaxID=2856 RepID=A0AAD2CK58_9STRA|nr:unnamed protein product [Cylindrotheca closterium]